MNTRVSYGALAPSMIGALGVIVTDLLEKGKRGEFPVSLKLLTDVIEFSDGGIWGNDSLHPEKEPRVFRVSDFSGDFRLNYSSAPARAIAPEKLVKFQLQRGDILVVKSSGSANQVVSGRVAVFEPDTEQAYAASNFTMRLRPKTGIDPHYLAFVLGSPPVRETVADSVKTMTYPNLSFRIYSTIQVPVIPLADQQLVGQFFRVYLTKQPLPELPKYLAEVRQVVALIEDLADQIHEARTLRRQSAEEADVLVSRSRSVRFVELGNRFSPRPLGELISMASGEGLTSSQMDASAPYAVYGGGGLNGRYTRYLFKEPKIVIGRVGARCGCVFVTEPKAWVTDNALYLTRISDELHSPFLVHALTTLDLRQQANQAAQPVVSQKKINPMLIPVPPISEQRRIVAELEALQAEVDALQRLQAETATELNALLPSILDKAFKGQL